MAKHHHGNGHHARSAAAAAPSLTSPAADVGEVPPVVEQVAAAAAAAAPPPPPPPPAEAVAVAVAVVEMAAPVPPTFLTWSEAKQLLMDQGGLRELEARRALQKIAPASTGGEWKKWHRRKLLEFAQRVREDAEAGAAQG